jgi:hypothetical protein
MAQKFLSEPFVLKKLVRLAGRGWALGGHHSIAEENVCSILKGAELS